MSKLLVYGGTIITMDENNPRVDAVLIEDGIITAVGTEEEVVAQAASDPEAEIRKLDLQGNTAVPGLHDCHVHVMGTGLNAAGIDVYDCKSISEIMDLIKEADEKDKGGDSWIYCSRLDESRLLEKRPPTRQELDRVINHRGVFFIDRGLHYTLVNTKAYEEIGFDGSEAGVIKDEKGEPTGRLHDKANGIARSFFNEIRMTDDQRAQMLHYTAQEAVKKGITTIHGMEGGDMFSDKDIPVFMREQDKFPLDILLYWDTENVDNIIENKLPRVGTDLLLDGSIGSRTAAFDDNYKDGDTNGIIYFTEEFVTDHITKAHQNGLQAGFHAIGQRGIRFVLDCLEKSLERYPCEGHRFRIEHFGFCDDRDIERAAKLGCVISTQPSFSYLRGGEGSVYNLRLGTERERKGYPLKKFVEAGIKVGGGSDSGVTPMDPILGIHAALHQSYPENNVDIHTAMRMFTIDGAYCAFEEDKKGSIETGKYGDITVLSDDPYRVDPDRIKDIQVVNTIFRGKVVY